MNKLFSLLIILLAVTSCNPFYSRISTNANYPPIVNDEPAIIYFHNQELPDSAEYIGDISVRFNAMGMGAMTIQNMVESAETDIKRKGGNAIQLNEDQDENSPSEFMTGKVYRLLPFENINISTDGIKKLCSMEPDDKFIGIYQKSMEDIYKNHSDDYMRVACVKRDDGEYSLIYIDGLEVINDTKSFWDYKRIWKHGDILANLNKTVNANIFKANYFSYNKAVIKDITVKFDNGNIRCYFNSGVYSFRKVFPDSADFEETLGSLTGFAINNNRIITCYHGVQDKKGRIFIKGVNKQFNVKYEGVIENYDKINDIAIIKLVDSTITIANEPFDILKAEKSTGDEVFVLGYPLSNIMGEEIKLTNGIISSQSGFAGDIATYQISAPVQPGNSGAPVLDKSGRLIGMVNSKLQNTDNVAYSIKINLINNFLADKGYKADFISDNDLSASALSDKIKASKGSIFIIEIINTDEKKVDTQKINKNKKGRRKYEED